MPASPVATPGISHRHAGATVTSPNTITKAHVDDLIARSQRTDAKMGEKTTVVCLKLPNGYEIIESSGCVDPANYNHDMGVKICMERIVNRVWQLEGYRLQCELATKERELHTLTCHLGHVVTEEWGTLEQVLDSVRDAMCVQIGHELHKNGLTNFREIPVDKGQKRRFSMTLETVVRDPGRLSDEMRKHVKTARVVS